MRIIRKMKPEDNASMAKIIVDVLTEYGYRDSQSGGYDIDNLPDRISDLYGFIQKEGGVYFVIEDTETQRILGGGGFRPNAASLKYSNANRFFSQDLINRSCALEKLYFLPELRGQGFGLKILEEIQAAAIEKGYSSIYAGTEPNLKQAQSLYKKAGFIQLETTRKNSVCFLKALKNMPVMKPGTETGDEKDCNSETSIQSVCARTQAA
ncbi:GNAT family N-acetyltransferase [Legionella genomosp. 1]|uniref:GNAT family N-acetyltransferase n=1 Tax=Legionella genomosp. 1 TaxID=1093625 RepID=UPI0013EF8280|nr:GNAT family N-acetyltransferase [Legionella genomosp. 1]